MAISQKSTIRFLIFAAIGILVVYFVFRKIDIPLFTKQLGESKSEWILVAFIIGTLSHLIRALRWKILLKPLGYSARTSTAFFSVMTGYLVNLGIPRAGEISRCAALSKKENIPIEILIGTVIAERLIDMIMLLIIVLLTVVFQTKLLGNYVSQHFLHPLSQKLQSLWGSNILYVAIAFLSISILIFTIFKKKSQKKEKKASKLIKMINGFANGVRSVLKVKQPFLFVTYTIGIWTCYWLTTQVIFLGFDFSSGFGPEKGLTTLVFSTVGVMVPAPGGIATIIAVKEGVMAIYNLQENDATILATVLFASQIIMLVVVGIISFIGLGTTNDKKPNNEEIEISEQN